MKKATLTFALILLNIHFVTAQIAGSMLVSNFISQTKNFIQDILNDADFIASKNSFEIRQHLLLLEDNLEEVGTNLLDKTFDEVDKEIRLTFNQINNTVNNFNSESSKTLQEVNSSISNLNDAFATLPFSKDQPRILKCSPSTIGKDWQRIIEFGGSFLGKAKKVKLTIDGQECKLISNTENQLKFEAPPSVELSSTKIEKVYGNLSFTYKKGLFSKRKDLDYKVLLFKIPNEFGEYKLEVKVQKDKKETSTRTERYSHRNDHCQGRRNKTYNINARSGWKIDVNTIDVDVDASRNSQFNGVFDKSEHGFQLRGSVSNHGNCTIIFGGQCSPCDARGSLKLKVKYKEFRLVKKLETVKQGQGILTFSNEIKLDLPENTKNFFLTITDINGNQQIISETVNQDMFDVEYVPSGNAVIIRIKDINEIF